MDGSQGDQGTKLGDRVILRFIQLLSGVVLYWKCLGPLMEIQASKPAFFRGETGNQR